MWVSNATHLRSWALLKPRLELNSCWLDHVCTYVPRVWIISVGFPQRSATRPTREIMIRVIRFSGAAQPTGISSPTFNRTMCFAHKIGDSLSSTICPVNSCTVTSTWKLRCDNCRPWFRSRALGIFSSHRSRCSHYQVLIVSDGFPDFRPCTQLTLVPGPKN